MRYVCFVSVLEYVFKSEHVSVNVCMCGYASMCVHMTVCTHVSVYMSILYVWFGVFMGVHACEGCVVVFCCFYFLVIGYLPLSFQIITQTYYL